MFSFLKKLAGKPAKPAVPPRKAPAPSKPASPAKAAPAPQSSAKPISPAPALPKSAALAPAATVGTLPPVELLSVPLSAVVERWPDSLKARLLKQPRASDIVQLDARKVADQLATGSIKLTFKEIRDRSPAGLFADSPDAETVIAEVPLKVILPLLKPGQIKRRTDQKKSIVPEEISPLFGSKGEPLRQSNGIPAPIKEAAPVRQQVVRPPESVAPSRPPEPAAPIISKPPEPEIPRPVVTTPPPPAPVAIPSVAPEPGADALSVTIDALLGASSGPDAQDFQQLRGAVLSIPLAELENGLKRGKLSFSWGQLRNWIKTAGGSAYPDIAVEKEIDLPLKVLAPLFIAQKRPAKLQKKVVIGENIPSLFSGSPGLASAPSTPPPAEAAPVQAPAPPIAPPSPTLPAPAPKPRSKLGEIFGQPEKHDWSPAEIVQRVGGLGGVSGALIVMSDGLLVAGQLPDGLNKDNVAAFIPQMFGRILQYTAELKRTETNNVTVLLENTALQIFKKDGLFLAVIGRDNETLPKAQLAAIVTELGSSSA